MKFRITKLLNIYSTGNRKDVPVSYRTFNIIYLSTTEHYKIFMGDIEYKFATLMIYTKNSPSGLLTFTSSRKGSGDASKCDHLLYALRCITILFFFIQLS